MNRSVRNCNLFNIRINPANNWLGRVPLDRNTDREFERFRGNEYGNRAGLILLRGYYLNHNCRTVSDFITRFAPPTENNTAGYINYVCKVLNENKARIQNLRDWIFYLAKAIVKMESGIDIPICELQFINLKFDNILYSFESIPAPDPNTVNK